MSALRRCRTCRYGLAMGPSAAAPHALKLLGEGSAEENLRYSAVPAISFHSAACWALAALLGVCWDCWADFPGKLAALQLLARGGSR